MSIARTLAALAVLLACCCSVIADSRVEIIGCVTFNGFAFGFCGGGQPCPLTNVRVGEYAYATVIVDDNGYPGNVWPPCPNHPTYTPTEKGYNLRDGTFFIRMGGVDMAVPVGTNPNGSTVPYFRMNWQNCTVDRLDLEGAAVGRGGGCCYPNGSCTYVKQADCTAGTWQLGRACSSILNPCSQPTGVCCGFDDSCTVTLKANCAGLNWTSGGACTSGICPQEPGSCCFSDGSCAITTAIACQSTWTSGGACTAAACPRPAFNLDYGFAQLIAGGATGFFTSADIALNRRTYPTSVFDPNYQLWQLTYGFIDATGPHQYDLDVPLTAMVISDSTTPTGSCCPGDGHCLVCTQAICPISSSWISGGACLPTTCPAGAGACCAPAGTCSFGSPAVCATTPYAVYQGDNTTCGVSTCPLTGGCCVTGSCSVIIQSACLAQGGSWIGVGSTCAVIPQNARSFADLIGGRCCAGNGSCGVVFQSACSGGTWTAGQTCEAPCPNAGACCDFMTGACVMQNQASCLGTWSGTDTCATLCFGTGSCCNPTTASCSIVYSIACPSGSTFTVDGTCEIPCPGSGACCNTTNGICFQIAQAQCQAGSTWNPASTCATPCSTPGTLLLDALAPGATPSDAPKPNTPSVFSSTIAVSDPTPVRSLIIDLNIASSRANDLKVRLAGPNGASVDLMVRVGSKAPSCTVTPIGGGYTMSGIYIFDDAAPMAVADFVAATSPGAIPTGRYKPASCGGAFATLGAAFAGESPVGNWTLTIIDERNGIRSTLYSWGLSINGGNPAPCTVGKCIADSSCFASTFALCTGQWSLGACAPAACSTGTPGACCLLDTCAVVCSSLCPASGSFRDSGTACTPISNCFASCCAASGVCTLSTPTDCAGTPGAVGSLCAPNPCPQPEACCLPTGACLTRFAIACTTGTAGGPGSTCSPNTCAHPTSPANDLCSIVSPGGIADVALNSDGQFNSGVVALTGATSDGVIPTCAAGVPTIDLWWRFTPALTGNYHFSTCSSTPTWDSTVSLWTDCATQLPGACIDDGGLTGAGTGTGSCSNAPGASGAAFGHGSLTATLSAGTNYLIRVGTYSPSTAYPASPGGTFPLQLNVNAWGACCFTNGSCFLRIKSACTGSNIYQGPATACAPAACVNQPAQPLADACASVSLIGPDITLDAAGAFTSNAETMAGATADGNVPSCAFLPSPDVWWRFTAPGTGAYVVRTCGSATAWDTTVSIWSNCVSQIPGACGDDNCASVYGHGATTTTLTSGTTYLIRVGLYSAGTTNAGAYQLDVRALGACCTDAIQACALSESALCASAGQTFRGLHTVCGPNSCVSGVCCRGTTCNSSITQAACTGTSTAFVSAAAVCNTPGNALTPCCHADHNKSGVRNVSDIFAFLTDWFAASPRAVFGGDGSSGTPVVSHIFAFLSAWFAGGCG